MVGTPQANVGEKLNKTSARGDNCGKCEKTKNTFEETVMDDTKRRNITLENTQGGDKKRCRY